MRGPDDDVEVRRSRDQALVAMHAHTRTPPALSLRARLGRLARFVVMKEVCPT
jgi:hypothetical protein